MSVSDLYIPAIDLPILLQENMWSRILGKYINRSQTHECGNGDWGRTIPRKGIHTVNGIFIAVHVHLRELLNTKQGFNFLKSYFTAIIVSLLACYHQKDFLYPKSYFVRPSQNFLAVFLFSRQEFSHHAGIFPVISPSPFFIPGRLPSPVPADGREQALSNEKKRRGCQ